MTNITRITALLLSLLLLLTGCSGTTGESTTADSGTTAATTAADPKKTIASTIPPEQRETLTVYALAIEGLDYYALYAEDFAKKYDDLYDVQIEKFTDAETMEARLKVELPAGQGPDIILGSFMLGLDMMSLAENGAFYDMTDIIAADEEFNEENYYTAVMKAGQVEERQYVIPLCFSIPMFASTTSTLSEIGIDWDNEPFEQTCRRLLDYLKAAETPQITGWSHYRDLAPVMMQMLGINPTDYGTAYTMTDENARLALELSAEMHRQRQETIKNTTGKADAFFYNAGKCPLYYSHLASTSYDYSYLYSGYTSNERGEEFVMYFPTAGDDGGIHALVPLFAAVPNTSKNPEAAWILIRYLIDYPREAGSPGMPFNRNIADYMMKSIQTGFQMMGDFTYRGLPKSYAEQILDAFDRIDSGSIEQQAGAWKLLSDAMLSNASGEADFDMIADELDGKLNLYVNE